MTYSTYEREDFALPLPITQTARQIAQQFAQSMPTPQKAQQVRLNTLAVSVVNDYLQLMGVPTDLQASDSWNPVVRLVADVADLEVTGIGRLECRPVSMHEQTCQIPPEVWSDRIGYVVVQIDESHREATVLGFTQTAEVEELPISQLQPPEDLIDRLHQLMQVAPTASVETRREVLNLGEPQDRTRGRDASLQNSRTLVNLSQWFQDVFETGWQSVETLLNPSQSSLSFSFRSADSDLAVAVDDSDAGVRRAKLIDLGMQLSRHLVTLIVEIRPESEQKNNILLQMHPAGSETYLPPLLQLTVLDEYGATFLEAVARSADNYIQLKFSGEPGERFSVKVAFGYSSITEYFVI